MSPADLVDYLIGWNELKAFARRYSAEQEGKLDMHPDSARRRHG
ncbi:ClbS/DfsB family four-helix bundle protein [Mycetocola sp. JXN-3]|nr:ClbS/DfsB family four-helix bundle protein [Mycetocola sp. JXN-3]